MATILGAGTERMEFNIERVPGVNAMATLKQMKDAAYNGVWHCHGFSLEPDAECPKCKNSVM